MDLIVAESNAGFSAATFSSLILGAFVALLVLGIFLPFSASLLVDGLVFVLRGRSIRPLLVAAGLTVAIAIAGAVALALGGPQSRPSASASVTFLLPWGCGLAALALLIRQARGALQRR